MKKLNLSFISILVALAVIVVVAVIVFISVQNYGSQFDTRRANEIRDTVLSSVSQCYALEGEYPPDLAYLEANYALILDKSRYIYHYQLFASNIFPDVKVLAINKAGE